MPILNNLTIQDKTGLYREFQLDANGVLQPNATTTHIMDFTGMSDVSIYALSYAYAYNTVISGAVDMSDLKNVSGTNGCQMMFYGCTGLTSVDLSGLESITGGSSTAHMFEGCSGLTSVDLSGLKSIWGSQCSVSMFEGCTGLTSVDLSGLNSITGSNSCGSMFRYCTGLTSVDLSSLVQLGNNTTASTMFTGCTSLTNVNLSSLTDMSNRQKTCSNMFSGCSNLTSLSFPSITPNSFGTKSDQFSSMCSNIPNITLHFPSNTQAKVETLTGYSTTAPFGASAGTVLFDLPATYTLTGADSVTYTRNPKYDTGTALAWKTGAYGTTNFTPAYYTSGLTDPTVGTTIYSDAACTTAVTTISSIA